MQPKAKIYFAPFPSFIYGHQFRDSVLRARRFHEILNFCDISVPVLNVSKVDLPDLLSIGDWAHYSPKFYERIANQISL